MDRHRKKRLLTKFFIYFLLSTITGCCLFPVKPRRQIKIKMKVTGYCSCGKCTGWERTCWNCFLFPVYAYGSQKGKRKEVGITSDGSEADHGTIAADLKYYPYGTKMEIPGYGRGVVHDKGSAIKGSHHIDLYFDDHDDALAWGVKYLKVTVSYY